MTAYLCELCLCIRDWGYCNISNFLHTTYTWYSIFWYIIRAKYNSKINIFHIRIDNIVLLNLFFKKEID